MKQLIHNVPIYSVKLDMLELFQYLAINGSAQIYKFDFKLNDIFIIVPNYLENGNIEYNLKPGFSINGTGI